MLDDIEMNILFWEKEIFQMSFVVSPMTNSLAFDIILEKLNII